MKYFIIVYIALGFVLSSAIGVTYYCDGLEMFPEYYGSPFVFKQKSLGSSMTYYFSISGILLNVAAWGLLVLIVHKVFIFFIEKIRNNKIAKLVYKGLVVGLMVFSTLNILADYVMLGRGFKKGLNYWYMNVDEEAKVWGMDCEGKWTMFGR
ncbi:MAG: hypothetical protein DI539_21045 [Flavobacterium psychrophilum]|jgi:hypothetical protein|nr:MAG: hypothetical protein DI539_21045 [Flavobacterium psychrophilum]